MLTSLVAGQPAARASTSMSVAGPGHGTWQIGQMWHGPELGGLVPARTAIDLSPIYGSPLDVYAVAAGRIVGTCVSSTQSTVYVDSVGIGVIGYVHLATGSIRSSGLVAQGDRLGSLATRYVRSPCATSWTGPHLHLAFPSSYDVLDLAGQRVSRLAVLEFGTPSVPRVFAGHPAASLKLTRSAARVEVCADNLAGNVVHVRLNRAAIRKIPARVWRASKVATSRCVRFENLDGAGGIVSGTPYRQRSAINQPARARWKVQGCFRSTHGQALCDKALLNFRQ